MILMAHHLPTCSYWDSFFCKLTFSSLILLTSSFRALFSFSRNAALNAIWFSLMRRASRDLFAAMLFLVLLIQYLSSLQASGTKTFACRKIIEKTMNSNLFFLQCYLLIKNNFSHYIDVNTEILYSNWQFFLQIHLVKIYWVWYKRIKNV